MRALKFALYKISYFTVRANSRSSVPYRDVALIFIAFFLGTIYAGLRNSKDSDEVRANCVASRLAESELNWRRSTRKLYRSEDLIPKGKFPNQLKFEALENLTVIWDYFVSSFDCPFTTERLGRVGDGGKWVCGTRELAKKPDCVVYSFGVREETSFEEEILIRTKCRVHMFDPTGFADKLPILSRFPQRVTFSKLGIGTANVRGFGTLKTLMDRNGDTFADILKIDIEGAEWEVLPEILTAFEGQLPFGQLQLEIHLGRFNSQFQYEGMRSLWSAFHRAGLRPFHDEPNLLVGKGVFLYHEFSFLNTKSFKSPFNFN